MLNLSDKEVGSSTPDWVTHYQVATTWMMMMMMKDELTLVWH